jgi:hypothetical protein
MAAEAAVFVSEQDALIARLQRALEKWRRCRQAGRITRRRWSQISRNPKLTSS